MRKLLLFLTLPLASCMMLSLSSCSSSVDAGPSYPDYEGGCDGGEEDVEYGCRG